MDAMVPTRAWCKKQTHVDASSDRLKSVHGRDHYHHYEQFEVAHYFFDDDDKFGVRWLYHAPGSGVWFDPGRTLVVNTHAEINDRFGAECPCFLYGVDNCARRQEMCNSSECPTVSPNALKAARSAGYDSIQILRHRWDDCDAAIPKYEVIDLQQPYVEVPENG